jgi:hypothetical protein
MTTNPTLTRRALLQKGALATAGAAALSTVTLEACNAQAWIQTALNDLPTILQIVTSIISIVGAATGSADAAAIAIAQKAAADATAALQAAQNFIQQYQANASAGLLNQIDNALTTAQSQLSSILTALHITNPTLQATIAAAIGSALAIVVYIQSLVPPPAVASAQRRAIHASANSNAGAIKAAYNEAVVAAGSPQFQVR